jgi:lipopolysaccharide exporter
MASDPLGNPSVISRVARGTGWVVAWRVATRNLGLLSTLVLVRLLRPEDFGLVALATGFANAVDSLSAIGVQDALVREASPGRDMYDTAFSLNAIRGTLTGAIIAALAWPSATFFTEPRLISVMLTLAGAMLMSAFENIGTVDFRRDFAFRKEFNLQIVPRVIGVATTIVFAALWRSYWALVVGIVIWRIARLLQSYTMSSYRPRLSLHSWRRLIGFSLWTWLLTVLFQIRDRGDSVIIGRLLGTARFGIFSIGSELGSLPVTELVEPLSRTLYSGFALLHRTEESPTRLYLGAVEIAIMLILPAGLGISMVADPMVRVVMGTQWLSVVPVMQIIAVACPLSVFGTFSGTFLSAGGQPKATFLLSSVSVAIRIPVMIVLVYSWGLPGAAVGVAVAMLIDQGLFLWRTMRRLTVTIVDLLLSTWRPMAASLVMVGCLGALGMAWTPGDAASEWATIADLAGRCATGAAVYVAALLLTWLLAGRPEGIERQCLTIARRWLRARVART